MLGAEELRVDPAGHAAFRTAALATNTTDVDAGAVRRTHTSHTGCIAPLRARAQFDGLSVEVVYEHG
jgi:hypothetical protein